MEQGKQMTVTEALRITAENLEAIQVPVGQMESIGIPIAKSVGNIRMCIDALEEADRKRQEEETQEQQEEAEPDGVIELMPAEEADE